jgi:hypothetical protein
LGGRPIKQERRKHKRIPLHFYLQVSEQGTKRQLGDMTDVSKEGFKLISKEKIEVGTELLCVLHLPEEFNDRRDVSFVARACWCHKDKNSDSYSSGYNIEDIEPDGPAVISTIMHFYGYKI